MSFILDALKRADAERAHGRVPGLHTQAILPGRPTPARRQPASPYLLLMGGLALALLCLALWNWLKPTGPAASNAPAALPPMAALSTPTPIAAPAPASPDSAAVRPAAPPANRSAPGTDARAAAKAPTPPKTPAKRPVEVQSQAQPVAASPKAPTANPSPALSELPQDIRQALPKLVISGSIYSETAAHRMLIINGQVFHEGEKPAPNVELEQIKPKAAVFNFKGQRYSMGY